MRHYTPATRVYVCSVTVLAVSLAAYHLQSVTATPTDWLALGLLAACAALAHFYPVRSSTDGAVYPMTNVFVIAGVVLLPAGLVALLPIIALTPDTWRQRRNAGALVRWLFNVSQTSLAAFLAGSLVSVAGIHELRDVPSLAVGVAAATVFVGTQCLLVGIVIALNSRIPFSRTGTFATTALLGEALKGAMAIAVAGLWRAEPVLLTLVPALLIIAHRMTRTAHLAQLAEVDAKTGLHNSQHFERALEDELAHSRRVGRSVAVMFLDLDHFKVVNDRHGHSAGDRVLRDVAFLVSASLRKSDVVARFGGEEFVAVLPGTDAAEAVYLAERVRMAIEEHVFGLDTGAKLRCTASLGIAVSRSSEYGPADLVQHAKIAMHEAKTRKLARYEVFDPAMTARALHRLQVETDLRRAIEHDELRVYYQPVVHLETGRITEVEALVRWQHPERGLLSPAEFIPVAEETGLIVPIERWLLAEACRQVRTWQSQTHGLPLVLNVNLSPRQFAEPEELVETTSRVLQETGLEPHQLKLEVTESLAMQDPEIAVSTLWLLKGLGIQLAIDDFGTGYSSLSYLERFPIDTLKIDRSFIDGLAYSPHALAIARTTITLAKTLNLSVTAEGITSPEQIAQLRALRCDQGQGFYFAQPLPGSAIGELLAAGHLPTGEPPIQFAAAA